MISLVLEYLEQILAVAGLIMVALISPGPDFAVIIRNSLIYSRKTGLLTALGIATGTLFHVSYILLGLGVIILESPWVLIGIKYLGASYLIYIGYKGVKVKKSGIAFGAIEVKKDISPLSAFWSGFLTNALNPKCMLFFISLFSIVVSPDTPTLIMIIYGLINFVLTMSWFSIVVLFLSGKNTREKFSRIGYLIERTTGVILIVIGVKLFFIEF